MPKPKRHVKQRPFEYFGSVHMNMSTADRIACDKYERWCAGLGIQPANREIYLGMNRPVTQPNNIDVILLA